MAEPKYRSKVGQYQLAAFENKTQEGYPVLKFSLSKSYKDKNGEIQYQNINLSGIQSVRELPTIFQQLAEKAEKQVEAFKLEQNQQQQTQQANPSTGKPNSETQKI